MRQISNDAGALVARSRNSEGGWALLGLLLALSVLAVALLEVVPSIQTQVRREKEAEMIYRGHQMAEGIARYYNRGALAGIQVNVPPPYGYLLELKRLREGVTIGINEFKFVRPSAMIDPVANKEWEPVRIRDPRLFNALQAYAVANQTIVPPNYLLLAQPPPRLILADPESSSPSGVTTPPSTNPQQPGGTRPPGTPPTQQQDPDDLDDDDDDPLSHLIEGTNTGLPIIGVAPRLKGASIRSLWKMKNYEEWVFIYVPPTFNQRQQFTPGSRGNTPGVNPPGDFR